MDGSCCELATKMPKDECKKGIAGFVEGAQHPGAIARMERKGFPASLLRTVLVQAARQADVPLITLTNGPQFGEREFRDPKHLNEVGAARYSQWLGEVLSASSMFAKIERGS